MGKAGSKLKIPSTKFIDPRIQRIRYAGFCKRTGLAEIRYLYIRTQTEPIIRLVKGPAKAIFASCPGFLGISSMADTPPKKKKSNILNFDPITPCKI
jgi:hypothetical protein